MIVKMQKLTILVSTKHREEGLKILRKLGVVHVKHLEPLVSKDITSLEEKSVSLSQALSIIGNENNPKAANPKEDVLSLAEEIIGLQKNKTRLFSAIQDCENKLDWFSLWGKVSLSSLRQLEDSGIFVKLYICSKKALKNLPKDKFIQILRRDKTGVYLALVSFSKEERLDLEEVMFPDTGARSLEELVADNKNSLRIIEARIKELGAYRKEFLAYKKSLAKEIEFTKVRQGMAKEEGFSYLEGFCPKEAFFEFQKTAFDHGWGYVAEEPDDPQEVPTLIKNPNWLKIINPVFKFMGTLPGYNEFDISLWFLLFFSLFFAMLIGDAGYGFLFLFMSMLARKKFKNLPGQPFILIYVLSIATIFWGAVTGTWFGYEKIARLPFFSFLVINQINSFVDTNQIFMMYLCFLIGVVHLSIAHALIAVKMINSPKAVAQLGWVGILWGLFFIAGKLVLNKPLPGYTPALFILGVLAVVFFSNPQKNILKGILVSLADLPLKIISSFSDVVSYIRLFAVGTATVVVAKSFNDLALANGVNSLIGGLIAALILFFGHTLNILLGLMSVIVHGVRLNMLEFSGHLNMQWSGRPYEPFRE
ncbi:MAG: hypothetical protein JW734_04350 [Candidatus Omnitrophica bacterium]|nr:hypothetical protein [Candidatus Omnitrophota bacterium]